MNVPFVLADASLDEMEALWVRMKQAEKGREIS